MLGLPDLSQLGWVMECIGAQHVLQLMWMAHPNQAGSLQGSHNVNCDILADNSPGTGSGWQQSKQNWVLPAVVGHCARMTCSDLCWAEDAPLHPFIPSPALQALLGPLCAWPLSLWMATPDQLKPFLSDQLLMLGLPDLSQLGWVMEWHPGS